MMAKTKSLHDLIHGQGRTDKTFAEALLREGINAMLSGDMETGKTILRDTIKATMGFEKLGEATGAPPKSLIRMFGPQSASEESLQLGCRPSRSAALVKST